MRATRFVTCTNLLASNTHHLLHYTEASTAQDFKILVLIFGLHAEVDAAGSGKRQCRSPISAANFERFVLYVSSSTPGKETLVPRISNRDKQIASAAKCSGARVLSWLELSSDTFSLRPGARPNYLTLSDH